MDRTAQIIPFVVCMLLGLNCLSQAKRHKVKAAPVYHLDRLQFDLDSSVFVLSSAKKLDPNVASVFLNNDSVLLIGAEPMFLPTYDTLAVNDPLLGSSEFPFARDLQVPEQMVPLSAYVEWDVYSKVELPLVERQGFIPLIDESIVEINAPDSTLISLLDVDQLGPLSDAFVPDSIAFHPIDSVAIATPPLELLMPDSTAIEPPVIEQVILSFDTLGVDSNPAPEPVKPIDSEPEVFGFSEPRPSVFDESTVETVVIDEQSSTTIKPSTPKTPKSDPAPTAIPVPPSEELKSDTGVKGKYDGLNESERREQTILDAEQARTLAERKMALEERRLELEFLNRKQSVIIPVPVPKRTQATDVTQVAVINTTVDSTQVLVSDTLASQGQINAVLSDSLQKLDALVETELQTPISNSERKEWEELILTLKTRARQDSLEAERNLRVQSVKIASLEAKLDTLISLYTQPKKEAVALPIEHEFIVYFGSNSAVIGSPQKAALLTFIATLPKDSELQMVLSGHADSSGDQQYNEMLTAKRIKAVREEIISSGLSPSALAVSNYGDQQSTRTKKHNPLDRKVVVSATTTKR